MRMESILDTEHNGLVLLKQSCGVLTWHLQADTSAEMTFFMPPTIVCASSVFLCLSVAEVLMSILFCSCFLLRFFSS